MVGSEDVNAVFEGLFVQGDGFFDSACVPVGVGEVVA